MTSKRKNVTMIVTVSVPRAMSARNARREVRSLISDKCGYFDFVTAPNGDLIEVDVKCRKVSAPAQECSQ